jgi:hypothetical protein
MQTSPLAQVTNLFGEAQAVPQLGEAGMVEWWQRALAGQGRPAFQDFPRLGAASDDAALGYGAAYHAAFATTPYTSIPVPYGVSVWNQPRVGDRALANFPESGSLTVAGPSVVATQTQATREVVTYIAEDGTVVRSDAARAVHLDREAWNDGYSNDGTSRTAGWGRTVDGCADLKGLPGNDAIEAQVALVTYVDHPLVMVLRWLDALLHQAETWLQRAWRWLWGQS